MYLRRLGWVIIIVMTASCRGLNAPDTIIDLGSIQSAGPPGYLCIPVDTTLVTHAEDDLTEVEYHVNVNSRLMVGDTSKILTSPEIYLEGYSLIFLLSTRIGQVCAYEPYHPGAYDVVLEVTDLHGGVYHFTATVTVRGE